MYILWSPRLQGWFTRAGTYTTERKDAEVFSQEDMLTQCCRHYNNGMSEFGLIPIRPSDLDIIAKHGV